MSILNGPYYQTAIDAADKYGVPQDLFLAQINQESGGNPIAYNPESGASGIAQFLPGTASQFGIDPFDPSGSLYAAAQYDNQLYQQYGDWNTAIAAYGGGVKNGQITAGGQGYISQVETQLQNLFGISGIPSSNNSSSANPSGAAPSTSNPSTGGVLQTFFSWIGNATGNFTYVVIGLVLLIGALILFAHDRGYLDNVQLPAVPVE